MVGIVLEEDTDLEVVVGILEVVVVGILEEEHLDNLVVVLGNLVVVLVVDIDPVVERLDIPMVVLDSLEVDLEVDIVEDILVVAVGIAAVVERHKRPVVVLASRLASGLVEQLIGQRLPELIVEPMHKLEPGLELVLELMLASTSVVVVA